MDITQEPRRGAARAAAEQTERVAEAARLRAAPDEGKLTDEEAGCLHPQETTVFGKEYDELEGVEPEPTPYSSPDIPGDYLRQFNALRETSGIDDVLRLATVHGAHPKIVSFTTCDYRRIWKRGTADAATRLKYERYAITFAEAQRAMQERPVLVELEIDDHCEHPEADPYNMATGKAHCVVIYEYKGALHVFEPVGTRKYKALNDIRSQGLMDFCMNQYHKEQEPIRFFYGTSSGGILDCRRKCIQFLHLLTINFRRYMTQPFAVKELYNPDRPDEPVWSNYKPIPPASVARLASKRPRA